VKTALGAVEQKQALLNEEDPIWTEIRHMHMKEAIDKLMVDFNRFTTEHAGFRNTWVVGIAFQQQRGMC
jgi:syntaxin-binding protein 1